MPKGPKRKSKMFEKWYGKPYEPKGLVAVKICKECNREMPNRTNLSQCPYCGGTVWVITRCLQNGAWNIETRNQRKTEKALAYYIPSNQVERGKMTDSDILLLVTKVEGGFTVKELGSSHTKIVADFPELIDALMDYFGVPKKAN